MPRFYVGLSRNDKEVWKAANVAAEGNFIVSADLSEQDPKSAERFKNAMTVLGRDANQRRQLSRYSWLFALEARLNDVFQMLVDQLGVEHHSYSAVDLKSGEGLAFDPEKRVVCEFYYKNWMA
jgi:hypothetical protein